VVPLDLGMGRVFKIGRQDVSLFVEPFWNISHDGPGPRYGITFGASLLYPDFWALSPERSSCEAQWSTACASPGRSGTRDARTPSRRADK
jgi:hypothetical protein